MKRVLLVMLVCALAGVLGACGNPIPPDHSGRPLVVTSPSFLADIVQSIAGDRAEVVSLVPPGVDPHSFEPTPRDGALVASADLVVINNRGLEPLVDDLIQGVVGKQTLVIEAAAGLAPRVPGQGKGQVVEHAARQEHSHAAADVDPHFWLNPLNVITYCENIRAALTRIDSAGADVYQTNAQAYEERLRALDSWISKQVSMIPPNRRLLVTNHESLGYFADSYGFRVVGTVFPTLGTEGAPSARQLAELVAAIRSTGAPAVFLETGNSPDLARQVARETGARVVEDLYTHSLGSEAPTYIDMMRWNVTKIVEALK